MWWEIIPPFAIMVGCIGATGLGMKVLDKAFHKGKPRRYNVDEFSKRLMDRDQRITGSKYIQKLYCMLIGRSAGVNQSENKDYKQ